MSLFGLIGTAISGVGSVISSVGQAAGNQTLVNLGGSIGSFGETVSSWGQQTSGGEASGESSQSSDQAQTAGGSAPAETIKTVKPITPPDIAETQPYNLIDDIGIEAVRQLLAEPLKMPLYSEYHYDERFQEAQLVLKTMGIGQYTTWEQWAARFAWWQWQEDDPAVLEAVKEWWADEKHLYKTGQPAENYPLRNIKGDLLPGVVFARRQPGEGHQEEGEVPTGEGEDLDPVDLAQAMISSRLENIEFRAVEATSDIPAEAFICLNPVEDTCPDGIYQVPFGYTQGNVVLDIFGPRRYSSEDGQTFTPLPKGHEDYAGERSSDTPMSIGNRRHEAVHSILNEAGLGSFTRSPLYSANTVLSDDDIINAFTNAGVKLNEIVEGGRQSTSLEREELLADLVALVAAGLVRPPEGFSGLLAASYRQGILYHTAPEDYYREIYPDGGEVPTGAIMPPEGARAVNTRLFTEESVQEGGVFTLNGQGNSTPHDAFYLGPNNAGYQIPEGTQVTLLGRTEQPLRDYNMVTRERNLDAIYWAYIGWETSKDSGNYRYAWVRQDFLNLDTASMEELNPIPLGSVSSARDFGANDPFNPPMEG